MEHRKTVAFVARRFARSDGSKPALEVDSKKYMAVILPSLDELRKMSHVDEVVLFLECGEEMLVDSIPETGVPLWKFHYVVCARNMGPVMERVSRVGHNTATLTPSDCDSLDGFSRILSHYLSTGETSIPEK